MGERGRRARNASRALWEFNFLAVFPSCATRTSRQLASFSPLFTKLLKKLRLFCRLHNIRPEIIQVFTVWNNCSVHWLREMRARNASRAQWEFNFLAVFPSCATPLRAGSPYCRLCSPKYAKNVFVPQATKHQATNNSSVHCLHCKIKGDWNILFVLKFFFFFKWLDAEQFENIASIVG